MVSSKEFLRAQSRQHRAATWRYVLLAGIAGLIGIGQAFCIGHIVAASPAVPWLLIGLLALAVVARGYLALQAEYSAIDASASARAQLRGGVIAQIVAAGPAMLRHRHSAELANIAIDSIEAMDGYFARYLPSVILTVLLPTLVLAASTVLSRKIGLIMALGGLGVVAIQALAGLGAKHETEKQFLALQRLQMRFLDRVRGIATIVLAGRADDEAAALASSANELRKRLMRVLRVAFLSSAALDCAMAAVLIAGSALLWRDIKAGRIDAADALTLLLLIPEFFAPLRQFAAIYQDRHNAQAAGTALISLPRHAQPKSPTPREIEARGISVALDNVYFSWDKTREPTLKNINFFVGPGEIAVLTGRSGAGKSTIIELLLGFITPDQGQIKLNGLNMADLVPASLTELTAWIGQHPTLFATSIYDNIALSKPGATTAQVIDAARAARVMEFADALPQGIHTPIGEGGYGLSGGQAQCVAIARAFLKNAPLLLLDEPTTHLDPLTEGAVLDSLRRLTLGRTVIIASHSAAVHAFGGRQIDIANGEVRNANRGVA